MKPQKILITGGSGFIGTHLCRLLMQGGHEVTIYDLVAPTELRSKVEYIAGDITDTRSFENVLSQDWDALYHFAAIVSVPECENNPSQSFLTNTNAVQTLLEFYRARKASGLNTPKIFFASSAAVYGDLGARGSALSESDHLPEPKSFYGLHKYTSEQLLRLYCKNFGLLGLSFRFFNVYGEGQKTDSPYSGVMTKFAQAFEKNEAITLYNHGNNERDFIRVEDIASACLKTLEISPEQLVGAPINLCTGKSISISAVYQSMAKDYSLELTVNRVAQRAGDIEFSKGDSTRAQALMPDWKPKVF